MPVATDRLILVDAPVWMVARYRQLGLDSRGILTQFIEGFVTMHVPPDLWFVVVVAEMHFVRETPRVAARGMKAKSGQPTPASVAPSTTCSTPPKNRLGGGLRNYRIPAHRCRLCLQGYGMRARGRGMVLRGHRQPGTQPDDPTGPTEHRGVQVYARTADRSTIVHRASLDALSSEGRWTCNWPHKAGGVDFAQ